MRVPVAKGLRARLDDVGRRVEVRLAYLEVDDIATLRLERLRSRQHLECGLGAEGGSFVRRSSFPLPLHLIACSIHPSRAPIPDALLSTVIQLTYFGGRDGMNVYLGTPRGFCAGVVMAIDVVEIALERFGAPVYMKHQIVHNPHVVDALESKGAKTVEEVDEIPPESVVVFSAHGSPPEDFERAKDRDLHVLDATCPLVTKVHNEAKRYDREGRKLIIVGHRGHQEVRGTMGHRPMFLIDERDGINLPEWNDDTPVTVLTQTTSLRRRYPAGHRRDRGQLRQRDRAQRPVLRHDQPPVRRQGALQARRSRPRHRERPTARTATASARSQTPQGVPAHLINSPEELQDEWFEGVENVGVTSGASTPEELVSAVVDAIDPDKVTTIRGAEEDIRFKLPKVQCCDLHNELWYA